MACKVGSINHADVEDPSSLLEQSYCGKYVEPIFIAHCSLKVERDALFAGLDKFS